MSEPWIKGSGVLNPIEMGFALSGKADRKQAGAKLKQFAGSDCDDADFDNRAATSQKTLVQR